MEAEHANGDQTKCQGWYTAFYRYAEYLRLLTSGALNHKSLYAYVGVNGKYVNSKNPAQRKRSASGLSRLLHSPRYAADFQESYRRNPDIFYEAAAFLSQDLQRETGLDQQILVKLLLDEGYAALRAGLVAEIPEGRIDLQIARLDAEVDLLRAWAYGQTQLDPAACLRAVLRSFFHIMAFGHLEENFANRLVDGSPTDVLASGQGENQAEFSRACVMRSVDGNPAAIENMWAIGQGGSFSIGRYVDCDAVETNGLVSRRHCCVFRADDTWYVRDEGSRFGTAVHRGAQIVWSSAQGVCEREDGEHPAPPDAFPLVFGDCIVLAGQVHYWFVSLKNVERLLVG